MLLVSENKDDCEEERFCRCKLVDETLEQTPEFGKQWSGDLRLHIGRPGTDRSEWDQVGLL